MDGIYNVGEHCRQWKLLRCQRCGEAFFKNLHDEICPNCVPEGSGRLERVDPHEEHDLGERR